MSNSPFPSPLLVPSFSSKGNLFICQGDRYISDNYSLLKALDLRVSQSYLISAYDYYYGFLPDDPAELPDTEYLFVDSGGYETSMGFEANEQNKYNYHVCPWDSEKMQSVYSDLYQAPNLINSKLIFTTFDLYQGFSTQLNSAIELRRLYPNAIISFLVKPHQCLSLSKILKEFSSKTDSLKNISILGFTEKELGYTVVERLTNLSRIRLLLNKLNWEGSIHLFGGLEPNLIRLYYFAGADIFDGLSWQRFRFRDGTNLFNPGLFDPSHDEIVNRFQMMQDNLSVLYEMALDLSGDPTKRAVITNRLYKYLLSNRAASLKEIEEKGALL